jgi:DNA-binding CsgD family transcriptional regulator
MSSATQQLVQAASLGEGSLKHPLLATVCDVSPRELEDGVRAAFDGNILEVNDAKDGYRFHHALMREAVADELLPAVRARLHERWADALDAEGDRQIGGDAALTKIAAAHHWSETDNVDRAFETAVAAAGWAHSIGAEAERASLLTHVLDLWPHVPNAAVKAAGDRNDILEEVLAARSRADQLNEALTLIEAQLRSDTHDADPVQRLHLHQLKAKYSNRLGRPDPGAEIGRREGIHLLLAAPSNAVFVRAVAGLIETDMGLVDVASSRQLLGRALDVADRVGRPLDTLALREAQVQHLWLLGQGEQATAVSLELLGWVREHFTVTDVTSWESRTIWSLCTLGRYREAADLGGGTLGRLPDPVLAPRTWAYAVEQVAYALLEVGDWDQAQRLLDTARALEPSNVAILDAMAGVIHSHRGNLREAELCLDTARSRVLNTRDIQPMAYLMAQTLAAEISAAEGRSLQAVEDITPVLTIPGFRAAELWRVLLMLARLEADIVALMPRRDLEEATELHKRVDEIGRLVSERDSTGDLGTAWTRQLAAERARVAGSATPDHWKAAIDGWGVTGQVHDKAWALVRLASCQIAAGDKKAGAASLAEAIDIGSRLGAVPLVHAAETLARRGRIDVRRPATSAQPARSPSHGLTTRELEVLHLVAAGRSNSQIAKDLFISPKTASVHVSHILAKLGVSSRSEAAARAHREGLLESPAEHQRPNRV